MFHKKILAIAILSSAILLFPACKATPDVADILKEPLPQNTVNMPKAIYDGFIKDIQTARKNIADKKNIPDAYITLGMAYKNFKEYEKSFAMYDEEVKLYPTSIVGWLNRSSILEDMGRYRDSYESYKSALKVAILPEAYFRMGIILKQNLNGSDAEIRALYDEALKNTEYNPMIVENYLAYLVKDKNDAKSADKILNAALKAYPRNERFLEIKKSYDNL
ncbi:hypothetical protein HZC20_01700 [Candidatus Peregrinibacteria bacterium]|nr:hypothetical protein [Candidatus Peregrinibacteria bacterium]